MNTDRYHLANELWPLEQHLLPNEAADREAEQVDLVRRRPRRLIVAGMRARFGVRRMSHAGERARGEVQR
jgi:hypothetical protein